jgi:hypothetical protein
MACAAHFILEPTAADDSFQNGIAERLNRTFGDMMCSMLYGAYLGPEYWSWALVYAAHIKNRLPHRAIPTTPYQAYTGKRPNIRLIHTFGSPVVARLSGCQLPKLDAHTATGIFLGFTATENNIYYRDNTT